MPRHCAGFKFFQLHLANSYSDRVAGLSFLLDRVQQLDAFVADEHRPRHCNQTFDFGLMFTAARTVERLVDHLVPPKKKLTERPDMVCHLAITASLNVGD